MRTRIRLIAVMFVLVGLVFIQDSGYLVPDTKFDLAVSPGHFLQRALHLWDNQGAFGQLQNQAYGYLWPMGPFFLLLHAIDVPGWVTQRLWQSLVVCAAFLGTARVTRALGARSDLACIVAGLAFALSPRMLTVLGPISIEGWPSAVAPWVLLALVRGSAAGSARRAAAFAGLAVAMVGGVNATATFAVIPLGVIWVLTRTPGPRRRSLMFWWPVFTLLGTLWWLVPLLLMAAYSPPFLDYIETTAVTTFPTTLFDALRGTSHWVPYLSAESRSGNDLLITPYLVLNSGLVLLAGLAGLMDRRNPHRLFLALSVVLGLLMVTAGHVGNVQGLFAGGIRGLLDGSLAPLRNVHKFDPIIRLPLVLGVGLLVDQVLANRRATSLEPPRVGSAGLEQRVVRLQRGAVLGMVLLGLGGSVIPALVGRLEPASPTASVPEYWEDAASWLAQREDDGTALLTPGSGGGVYLWGSPRDEPLQFLSRSPWAVRGLNPLSSTGNIRMLDAVEDRFAQGKGSAGLASYLNRNGVGYLVVRNDLRPTDDIPDSVLVHQTLADSPGLQRVTTFGPEVGGDASLPTARGRAVVNGGWQAAYPAVEIYAVRPLAPGRDTDTVVDSGASPTVVAGGPEDILDLEDLGVIGPRPVVLASDVAGAEGLEPEDSSYVLTDGLRRRERAYARVHDGYSSALTPGDKPRLTNRRPDYGDPGDARWATTVELEGATSISASSSASDYDGQGGTRRGELPYAAVDGSLRTEWASNFGKEGRTWWQLRLAETREVGSVTLTPGSQGDANQRIRVRTQNGLSEEVVAGPGESVAVDLPAGATRWIRVESLGRSGTVFSLAEVEIDGLEVRRTLVLPKVPQSWGNPRAVVLRADIDARRGCVVVANSVRCAAGKERASEEAVASARRFSLATNGAYVPELRVRPRSGAALEALETRQQLVNVSSSSVGIPDPRSSPIAAIDDNPATTWTADAADETPSLSLNWIGRRSVTGLSIVTSEETAARRPSSVTLVWPGQKRVVALDRRGRASFPAIRTSQLRVQVDSSEAMTSLGFDSRSTEVGVGIQELRLTGVPSVPLSLSTRVQDQGCGSGPVISVNGVQRKTSVTASPAQLFSGATLPASICGGAGGTTPMDERDSLGLLAGGNRLTVTASEVFEFVSLVLRGRDSAPAAAAAVAPETVSALQLGSTGSPVSATLRPRAGMSVVNLGQNENPGWQATQDGRTLKPVTLNGWQQGWFVRSEASVKASYAPDSAYRIGLGVGLASLLLLLGCALLPVRRSTHPEPLHARDLSWTAGQLVALGAAVLLAGWPGLLVAGTTSVLAMILRRRAPDRVPWAFASCALVAALGYFLSPWADPGGWAGTATWPHYMVLVPVVGAVVLAARDRRRFLTRMTGTSIKR